MAHIRQRGDRWQVIVRTPPHPVTGKRGQLSGTARNKTEAKKLAAQLALQAKRPAAGSFKDLAERWFALASPEWSPVTAATVRRRLDVILPVLGHFRLDRLTAARLDAFYRELGLAPVSVRKYHAIIHRAFEQGRKWGLVTDNPAALASPPKVPQSEVRPPAPEDVALVVKAAEPTFGLFLRLALVTGARRGELCALRWSDLDGDELVIDRTLVAPGGGLVEKRTKTSQGRRVALDPVTLSALQAHREAMVDLGFGLTNESYMFSSSPDGTTPWRPDSVTHRFVKLTRSVGVECRFHDLRHFAATTLIDAGIPIHAVSKRLGHRNAQTTVNTYAHAIASRDGEAASVLGNLLPLEDEVGADGVSKAEGDEK